MSQGGYEAVSRQLFGKLKFQRLLLEYDDERSGSFAPLKDVPDDKFIVLGLISTKNPDLESLESLIQRAMDAGRHIPLERLGISPQCGFASSIIGNNISPEAQRRKLELVVRTAREIWGENK
ncbi:MAG: vitamin-B12 independent methionine synthase [Candidatus Binatia bacterium]